MKKLSLNIIALIIGVLALLGCEQPSNSAVKSGAKSVGTSPPQPKPKLQSSSDTNLEKKTTEEITPEKEVLVPSDFMTASWEDLLPKDDLEALLNPPEYLNEILENSAEDQLGDSYKNNTSADSNSNEFDDDPYQKALTSTRVIAAVNNVAVQMPAFIVPLAFDDEQKVTQFFMVPYFGACMHMPPPSPNQTIYVNYPQGFTLESITEPYLISGVLKTTLVSNELATAAYSLEMHFFKKYYDD